MIRVPRRSDYMKLKALAEEVWSYEMETGVSRNVAIDTVCRDRYHVDDNGRFRIHDTISSLESHCAMKLAGLL